MSDCPFCGKSIEGNPGTCPHCGQELLPAEGSTPPPPPPESQPVMMPGGNAGSRPRGVVPFEDPSKGFFGGMLETIKLVLFQPTRFFSEYRMDGSIGRPMVFAIVVGWFAVAIGLLWGLLLNASVMTMISQYIPASEFSSEQFLPQYMLTTAFSIISLILAPIMIVIGLFILAGIYHLFLLMVGGATRGFETTFNVVSYRSATKLFNVVPFCGGLIAWIYGLVVSIIGLYCAHETDGWKGAFAVLAPFILCCCCIALIYLVGFGTLMAGLAANQ